MVAVPLSDRHSVVFKCPHLPDVIAIVGEVGQISTTLTKDKRTVSEILLFSLPQLAYKRSVDCETGTHLG